MSYEEEVILLEFCPHCRQEYDEISAEYQICHNCGKSASEKKETIQEVDSGIRPEYGLPVLHRAEEVYGCGSYALANLFNDPGYKEKLQDGERCVDLNKKLRKYYKEVFLEAAFFTTVKIKQNRLTEVDFFDSGEITQETHEQGFRAFLMTVYHVNTNLYHIVALCLNLKNGIFYVLDSNSDRVKKFTGEDLLEFYWIIGIEYFGEWKGSPENEIFFAKEHFSHIFEQGE